MDLLPPALAAYLPPHDGYLPKWLFLVRLPAPFHLYINTNQLTVRSGRRHLHRQQRPILPLPRLRPPALRRLPIIIIIIARHPPLRPHLRHLDLPVRRRARLRRLPRHPARRVRPRAVDVRDRPGAFCLGVVGVWVREVAGEVRCAAGGRVVDAGLDGYAEGVVSWSVGCLPCREDGTKGNGYVSV